MKPSQYRHGRKHERHNAYPKVNKKGAGSMTLLCRMTIDLNTLIIPTSARLLGDVPEGINVVISASLRATVAVWVVLIIARAACNQGEGSIDSS